MDSAATPTSPQPTSGNGIIAQPKKIRGVGFGDIFREGSVKLKVRLPSAETEEKKEKVSVKQILNRNTVCNNVTQETSVMFSNVMWKSNKVISADYHCISYTEYNSNASK